MFREGGTRPANENKPACVSAEEFDDGYIMADYVKKKKRKRKHSNAETASLCNIPCCSNQFYDDSIHHINGNDLRKLFLSLT